MVGLRSTGDFLDPKLHFSSSEPGSSVDGGEVWKTEVSNYRLGFCRVGGRHAADEDEAKAKDSKPGSPLCRERIHIREFAIKTLVAFSMEPQWHTETVRYKGDLMKQAVSILRE